MEQMAARWARLGEIRSVASGAAHVLLIRVVGAVLAYGSTIFLARTLGTFDFGLFAYFWTWIALLGVILPLGYNASVLRFLPDYKARSKWRRIHGFLREGYARSAIYGTAATLLGGCLLYAFPEMVGELYFKPLLYTLLCLPFAALLTQLEASARALGLVHLAYAPSYILRPILLASIVGGIWLAGTMPTVSDAVLALMIASIIMVVVQGILIKRRVRREIPAARPVYHSRTWRNVSIFFVLIEGFRLLLQDLDVLLMGNLLDPETVAVYFAAKRTGGLVAFIFFAVSALAVPKFAELGARGARADLQRFVDQTIQLTFWPTLLSAVILASVGSFALSLFGANFSSGYVALLIILSGHVLRTACGPVEHLLSATGHHNITALAYGIAAAINVALNIMLMPMYGIVGAALATQFAFLCSTALLYIFVRRRLGIRAFIYPMRRSLPSQIASASEQHAGGAA